MTELRRNAGATKWKMLSVTPAAIYVNEGKFWTSARVTAGIDLTSALIEQDYGGEL